MQVVTILGSTGSIGVSTLNVLAQHPDKYRIYALAANKSVDILFEQCKQFQPEVAVMLDPTAAMSLSNKLKQEKISTEVLTGAQALEDISSADMNKYLMENKIVLSHLVKRLPTLEQQFLTITNNN